jgi:hypothetical protein
MEPKSKVKSERDTTAFARGGTTHMLGKGDRVRTATRMAK